MRMRILLFFFLSSCSTFSQERMSIELGLGYLFNDTREKIASHMKEINYDHYVIDYDYWLIFPLDSSSFHVEHPDKKGFSTSLYGNFLYELQKKHKVGIQLDYDQFGTVTGNNRNFEEYSLSITSIKLFPMYKFELSRNFAITAATGMIINSSKGNFLQNTGNSESSSQYAPADETNRRFGTGLDLGFVFQFPFNKFYLFLGSNGSLQTSFVTGTLNSSSLYPFESLQLNNSYFGVNFGIGVNLQDISKSPFSATVK